MKNKKRRNLLIAVLACFSFFCLAGVAQAQVFTDWGINLGTADPLDIIVAIINWGLGILALIAVIIILYGGFVWMTAAGNEEKIQKAKLILRNGVIGLVIILAAWGIAAYIINILLGATGYGNDNQGYGAPYDGDSDEVGAFSVTQVSPRPDQIDVNLCTIISVGFNLPLVEDTVTAPSEDFPDELKNVRVFIPSYIDQNGNSVDAKSNGQSCADNLECRSGVCDNGSCQGNQMRGSLAFFESGRGFSFYHDDFLASTTYKVELGYGQGGIAGNDPETGASGTLSPSDALKSWYFTTGTETDEIPPQVNISFVSPLDGEENVCMRPPVQVTFNETMDPASIRSSNIWLYLFDNGVAGELPVEPPRFISNPNPYDTFISRSSDLLSEFTKYGFSLYSGDAATENFDGAMRDACGNPMDGNFNSEAQGSTTDDFIDPTSVKENEGWLYPWDFTTGDDPVCAPQINSIDPGNGYYGEDLNANGLADPSPIDSYNVAVSGNYLIGAWYLNFYHNVDSLQTSCFDNSAGKDHYPWGPCIVSMQNKEYNVRTPVGCQSGPLSVETEMGYAESGTYSVLSPYISRLSPYQGPPGQFVTIKGKNFGNTQGTAYFRSGNDMIQAEFPCANSWTSTEIIIRVPENLPVDEPYVEIVTADGKYSNYKLFQVTDGEPGPGICELQPNCSDDGQTPVRILGENFGDANGQNAVFFDEFEQGSIDQWNGFDQQQNSAYVDIPDEPTSDQETYDVKVRSTQDFPLSNGLDFDIPCTPAPEMFYYLGCSVDAGLLPLPNPSSGEDEACSNSLVSFAFTQPMNDASVQGAFSIYKCNNGEEYSGQCEPTQVGGYVTSAGNLPGAYIGEVGNLDYEKFKFVSAQNLEPDYWYNVTVTTAALNDQGVPVPQDYTWQFRVRPGDPCVADYTVLYPYSMLINFHDPADPCDGHDFNANAYNAECIELNINKWHWNITNEQGYAGRDIIRFSAGDPADKFKTGQNADQVSICTMGAGENNFGYADVTGEPWDEVQDVAMSSDYSPVKVDFGYCTDDTNCQDNPGCENSVCNLETSRCEPTINNVAPNPVGQNSCITVSGCYFGTSRQGSPYCECTVDNQTCNVDEGAASCLLPDLMTRCYLDANPEKADQDSPDYDPNYVLDTCVNGTLPGSGKLEVGQTEVDYLEDQPQCVDTWTDSSIIGQVQNQAGTYPVAVTSYFGFIYEYETDLTVSATQSPCLCRVDPERAGEGDFVDLYGKNFGNNAGAVSFYSLPSRQEVSSFEQNAWTDTAIANVMVPARALSGFASEGNEGVYVKDAANNASNPLDFGVSCVSNWQCSTGCCFNNQCSEENLCNTCADKNDCVEADGCGGECTDGVCDPVITSLSPSSGAVGQPVTVQGCHFGTPSALSNVTMGNVIAEYICGDTSWDNHEIYIRTPNQAFDDLVDEATVQVNRYTGLDQAGDPIIQSSNTYTFSSDDRCEGVLFPELCQITSGTYPNGPMPYGPFGAQRGFSGYNLTDRSVGFCQCETGAGQTCLVTQGGDNCSGQITHTLYAWADFPSQECTMDMDTYVEASDTCHVCLEADPTNCCDIPNDGSSNSCQVTENYSCTLDSTCNSNNALYTLQGGAGIFNSNKVSGVWDWDDFDFVETEVPPKSEAPETGEAYAQASVDEKVCRSNGVDFAVTCNSCGDCADGQNCVADGGLNYCTFEDTGFCRADTNACCGNTGCSYDNNDAADLGACEDRPYLAASTINDNNHTDICPNAALRLQFSETMQNLEGNITLEKNGQPVDVTIESQTGYVVDVIQQDLLSSGDYNLIITTGADTYPNFGVTSTTSGLTLDCGYSDFGSCGANNNSIEISFSVAANACDPDGVTLEAANIEFTQLGYIFTSAEQEEAFVATVYDNGNDGIAETEDDQALRDMPGVMSWDYTWDPKYETYEEMQNAQCGYLGIITGDPASFEEDSDTQTVTAGSPPEEQQPLNTSINVTVTGDGSTDHGWTGSHSRNKAAAVLFCPTDNLAVYADPGYKFTLLYCRGQEGADLLPDFFDNVTHLLGTQTNQSYLEEFLFSNADNEDLIGMRIYANDLVGDGNEADSASPQLWYTERAENPVAGYSSGTVDGYQSISVGTTTYVAGSTLNPTHGYPNIFLLSYNEGAQAETVAAYNEMLSKMIINNDIGYINIGNICTDNPDRVARDTKRLNDLGTVKHYLDNFRDSDLNGNGTNDFPKINTGSYIKGLSTSAWPSWNATLGNALATGLPQDPLNTFNGCQDSGDYDATTCWDALNNQFYGPAGSHVYLYKSNSAGSTYQLNAEMEYESSPWISGDYNPCSGLSESSQGCNTFNYQVQESI